MSNTKENILLTALHLFARDGYEAVSVSAMAGKLGMTKGALYKHYKNKRDIFNSIVVRMNQMDYERAKQYEIPEEIFEKMPQAYRNASIDKIKAFSEAQFNYWTEDEFASNFRKMLTLEQYRNTEMSELYQNYLVGGPFGYMEDLFREMIKQGILKQTDSKQLALEFYAPLYLLISISDALSDRKEITNLLTAHIDRFVTKNTAGQMQKD